jgi:hypothetical protein
MRKLILSALLLASAFQTALGDTFGDWVYSVSNNQATITSYTGAGGEVTIPSSVNGINVVQVGSGTFPLEGWPPFASQSIASINISQGISRIGGYAFYQSSIASVDIPNSVTDLGEYAFYGCSSLTALTIPDSVASIADGALCGLSNMTNFTLTASNPSFSYSNGVLFNKNQTFLIVAFPKILSGATYTIPNTVTNIGLLAFFGCENLTGITIPVGVINIGNGAFANCSGLTGTLTIPNSVTRIGMYAFNGCTLLENITIPATVTSIGDGAFENCPSMLFSSVISHLVTNQASNFTAGYTDGQQSVISNPNTYYLYTTSQIHYMAMGDLVLNRQENGSFVLNYDIEQSTDLQTWTPYQALSLPLTGLPTDKAFVRIKVINSNPPAIPTTPPLPSPATPTSSNL